jgi:hypothetical protein
MCQPHDTQSRTVIPRRSTRLGVLVALEGLLPIAVAQTQAPSIFHAVLGEPVQRTAEVSTAELEGILADDSAILLDARPQLERGRERFRSKSRQRLRCEESSKRARRELEESSKRARRGSGPC